MLQLAVGSVSWDLYHLLWFFAMVFLNFQLGGHVLFGSQLEEWSSMAHAATASVRMLLGYYSFDPMYEIAPFAATVWFWSFLVTMVFVLMNSIFALVADYLHVIRTSIGDTDPIWTDAYNAAVDLWWRLGWRKIQFQDGEYKMAFLENPYGGYVEGLMEVAEVPDYL